MFCDILKLLQEVFALEIKGVANSKEILLRRIAEEIADLSPAQIESVNNFISELNKEHNKLNQ